MPGEDMDKLEEALVQAGRDLHYPPTPALSARVSAGLVDGERTRPRLYLRPALLLLAAVLLACGLLVAFPETRDVIAQFLGLRTVRIIPITPTPIVPTANPPIPTAVASPTRAPSAQCCRTTLADAGTRSRFRILLPAAETPSQVFLQDLPNFGPGAQQVILVFGDPGAPRFTLYEATNFLYGKIVSGGTVIEETQVKGQRALWLSGAPHLLVYLDASGHTQFESERSVSANTLAWEIGNVTYRLETNLTKEEAIRIAESLQ